MSELKTTTKVNACQSLYENIIFHINKALNDGFYSTANVVRSFKYEDVLCAVACNAKKSVEDILNRQVGLLTRAFDGQQKKGTYQSSIIEVYANIHHYERFYSKIHDDKSRHVFNNLVLYRIQPDLRFIHSIYDPGPQYYDNEIIKTDENEIFLDIGSSIGDTILSYINSGGKYRRIYAYELSDERMKICRENTQKYENIIYRQVGVGDEAGVQNFVEYIKDGYMQVTNRDANKKVIVKLDDDVTEHVTFIKFDIEGMEMDAIKGTTQLIQKCKPKLAISIYHYDTDFWEIPLTIYNINSDYRFYLRHYYKNSNMETVLYAVI